MSYRVIQASEIGEYVYCRRAWWLQRRRGYESANVRQLEHGSRLHVRQGRRVTALGILQRLALIFLFVAVALLVFGLVS